MTSNGNKLRKRGRPVTGSLSSTERSRKQRERQKQESVSVRPFRLLPEQVQKYTEMKAEGLSYNEIIDLAYKQFQSRDKVTDI